MKIIKIIIIIGINLTNVAPFETICPNLFKASGILLPMGYGQGSGQANNVGLTYEALGKFLNMIPSPLGLGQILLINNTSVTGFICEPYAIEGAIDISSFGGYRYYLESKN